MPSLAALRDREAVACELAANGLSPREAAGKAELTRRAADALIAGGAPAGAPADACFVPGRIEVFGKHTDYAGGQSLVCACERGHVFVAVPREDATGSFTDALRGERVTCAFEPLPESSDPTHWSVYPETAVRRLLRNFRRPRRGLDLAFAGDLPPAAGLSTSTVLTTGTVLALAARGELAARPAWREKLPDALALGAYLGAVENGSHYGDLEGDAGVGTCGGCQDSVAILNARPGFVSRFRYGPVRAGGEAALPRDLVFAIGVSGVVAAKTGAARESYNRASELAADAAAAWRRATGRDDAHLGAAFAAAGGDEDAVVQSIRAGADHPGRAHDLVRRFQHFVIESERIVPAALAAFRADDRDALGGLGEQSTAAADQLLLNQVPETLALAHAARELGAIAAAPFGAGFGGSVWALIPAGEGEAFLAAWANENRPASPGREPVFFLTGAGPRAGRIDCVSS